MKNVFAENFKPEPYWWERSPRPVDCNGSLPGSADVLIVGSGYTGLSAAIQTAGHGKHTVVVDAEDAGWGCSSRNGGQISTSIKPSFKQLSDQYGADNALAILNEGNNALNWVESFTQDNNIQCDFRRVGRFYGAHNESGYQYLKEKLADTPKELGIDAYLVPPEEQKIELKSPAYHGGAVFPHHASIDPGRYHQGLLDCARKKGAEVISQCKVTGIDRNNSSFTVNTTKGSIQAKDVVIATSGYTSGLTPWHRNRIIPIGSYMIATEPLPDGLLEELIPNDRVITDTRRLVVYYRTCPERKRILFGGRVSLKETDTRYSAPKLHQLMVNRFPELKDIKVTHSWMGFVGYTFDEMPHLGKHDGIHYSMGYCGSGVSLSSYMGMKTGLKIVGDPAGDSALEMTSFPGRFYYRGNPWFLAPSIRYYQWADER